ncbi:hypothetical protein AB0K09_09090 [Streptomyces sp. NPDC049577]|uniref:hypothetical protein n=1 Tax=Streptomyces sp. NPDC049577 TaxID=3155153 RepID=UPI003421844C
MLSEAMTALAAAGGTAVVQAAGTDAWQTVRARAARLLGRGGEEPTRVAVEQLDRVAARLEGDGTPETEASRIGMAFGALLTGLDEAARREAAAELRELIALTEDRAGDRIDFSGTFHGPVLGKGTQRISYGEAPRR